VLSVNDAKRDLPMLLRQVEAEIAESARPTLNDVFIHLTGRNIKEQDPEGGFAESYAKYDYYTESFWQSVCSMAP